MQISFFSGPQCGLCDQANDLLKQLPGYSALRITFFNVHDEPGLRHRYGARIPVIKRNDTEEELAWPFNLSQLSAFLDGCK